DLKLEYNVSEEKDPCFHPAVMAEIKSRGESIGQLGELHPKKLQNIGGSCRIYYAEIDLSSFMTAYRKSFKKYQPISIYPGTERDW
ncbi:hypothetical protein ACO1NC_14020, partial [Staphylococcus aureus]